MRDKFRIEVVELFRFVSISTALTSAVVFLANVQYYHIAACLLITAATIVGYLFFHRRPINLCIGLALAVAAYVHNDHTVWTVFGLVGLTTNVNFQRMKKTA